MPGVPFFFFVCLLSAPMLGHKQAVAVEELTSGQLYDGKANIR